MAILVSEILTKVNDVLFPSGVGALTSIDTYAKEVLKDITDRADFLMKVGTLTATASVSYISYPDDMRPGCIPIIQLDDNEPMVYDPDESDYWTWQAADDATDEPEYFFKINGKLYFYHTWSTAAAALTCNISYAQIHPDAVTTILLGEPFRRVIYNGVIAVAAYDLERYDEGDKWSLLYERALAARAPNAHVNAHFVAYTDI